jgi:flagellar protein FlaI
MKEEQKTKVIETYDVEAYKVKARVSIERTEKEFVPIYVLKMPEIEPGTLALMDQVGERILAEVPIKFTELIDPKALEDLKTRFYEKSYMLLRNELAHESEAVWEFLAGSLVNEMLGLGKIEVLLGDGNLEDIVVNNAYEPVWVFHKKHGWLKTNVIIPQESQILNYASIIGRKVGRQITTLNPLMDAHLTTGDRVNATLLPISTKGNTISIRKFRRKPWVIPDLIENKTIDLGVAALLWTSIQFEMNMIMSGGTATGKTTFLNVLMPFIPINHRIISIEDTREIELPSFLHWVPLTTREPNPEGKGGVSMLDLLVNSLRMRPDRIIVGEIRRGKEAEVLFEAMHTGHSVYATLHADTAAQTYRRLVNPPISVPEPLLEALDLLVVMFRDRRKGIRRIYEVAELIPAATTSKAKMEVRTIYRWDPAKDVVEKFQESHRLIEKLKAFTGMTDREIQSDLKEKQAILTWMTKNKIKTVNGVGKVVAEYYQNPEETLKIIRRSNSKVTDLVPEKYLEF